MSSAGLPKTVRLAKIHQLRHSSQSKEVSTPVITYPSICHIDISEPRAFRQPNKAVNWLRRTARGCGALKRDSKPSRSQLTALFGCRNARGSEMLIWLIRCILLYIVMSDLITIQAGNPPLYGDPKLLNASSYLPFCQLIQPSNSHHPAIKRHLTFLVLLSVPNSS